MDAPRRGPAFVAYSRPLPELPSALSPRVPPQFEMGAPVWLKLSGDTFFWPGRVRSFSGKRQSYIIFVSTRGMLNVSASAEIIPYANSRIEHLWAEYARAGRFDDDHVHRIRHNMEERGGKRRRDDGGGGSVEREDDDSEDEGGDFPSSQSLSQQTTQPMSQPPEGLFRANTPFEPFPVINERERYAYDHKLAAKIESLNALAALVYDAADLSGDGRR